MNVRSFWCPAQSLPPLLAMFLFSKSDPFNSTLLASCHLLSQWQLHGMAVRGAGMDHELRLLSPPALQSQPSAVNPSSGCPSSHSQDSPSLFRSLATGIGGGGSCHVAESSTIRNKVFVKELASVWAVPGLGKRRGREMGSLQARSSGGNIRFQTVVSVRVFYQFQGLPAFGHGPFPCVWDALCIHIIKQEPK